MSKRSYLNLVNWRQRLVLHWPLNFTNSNPQSRDNLERIEYTRHFMLSRTNNRMLWRSMITMKVYIHWNICFFVCRSLQNSEAVLLVGETGTGKTTVCQIAALLRGQKLHILNCNQYTEASDFLGGYRPSRWWSLYTHGSALSVSLVHSLVTQIDNWQ